MNRIREVNNKFEVLITPNYSMSTNDPGFETLLFNWQDDSFQTYSILEFNNIQEAEAEAFAWPNIDWNTLITYHIENYKKFNILLMKIIKDNNIICNVDKYIHTQYTLKNMIFNRVRHQGKRFNLTYDMNDIFGFTITALTGNMLLKIENILKSYVDLRMMKRTLSNGVITIICKNDIGTTFEIRLIPTTIFEWIKYVDSYKGTDKYIPFVRNTLPKLLKDQQSIDNNNIY